MIGCFLTADVISVYFVCRTGNLAKSAEHRKLKQELKTLRRLTIYICAFAVFYFPLEVIGVIEDAFSFATQPWFFPYLNIKIWLVVLSISSSAFNPLLYGLSSHTWRQALLVTLRCGRGQVAPSEWSATSMAQVVPVTSNQIMRTSTPPKY